MRIRAVTPTWNSINGSVHNTSSWARLISSGGSLSLRPPSTFGRQLHWASQAVLARLMQLAERVQAGDESGGVGHYVPIDRFHNLGLCGVAWLVEDRADVPLSKAHRRVRAALRRSHMIAPVGGRRTCDRQLSVSSSNSSEVYLAKGCPLTPRDAPPSARSSGSCQTCGAKLAEIADRWRIPVRRCKRPLAGSLRNIRAADVQGE